MSTENPEQWTNEYIKSVDEFLEAADWITALERPLAVQLRALARSLDASMRSDGAVQSAAASQFAMTWQRLTKRGGSTGGERDPFDGLLQPFPGMED